MLQYRVALAALGQRDSDRDIARARLIGAAKIAALRGLTAPKG